MFAASLAIRVLWASLAESTPVSDFAEYDQLARRWLEHGAYDSARRPPGYPGFLAAVYACFGETWRAAYVAQAVVGAATSALIVWLASRMVAARTALIAGALHAVWPTTLAYVAVLASENLATPIVVIVLLVLTTARARTAVRCAFTGGGGIAFGLAVLVRPALVFLLPAALVLSIWEPWAARRRVLPGVVFVIGAVAALLPWQLHNARRGLGITTISTTGGINLWMGNNDAATTGGYQPDHGAAVVASLPKHEPERDRAFQRAALSWIVGHPVRYAELCARRGVRMWGASVDPWSARFLWPTVEDDQALRTADAEARAMTGRRKLVLVGFRLVVAPLMLVAFILSIRTRRRFAPVTLTVGCYALLMTLTYFQERFREVSDALLVIPTAALVSDLVFGTRELRGSQRRRRPAIYLGLALLAIVLLRICY